MKPGKGCWISLGSTVAEPKGLRSGEWLGSESHVFRVSLGLKDDPCIRCWLILYGPRAQLCTTPEQTTLSHTGHTGSWVPGREHGGGGPVQMTINSVFSLFLLHHLSEAVTCIWFLFLQLWESLRMDAIPLLARRGQPLPNQQRQPSRKACRQRPGHPVPEHMGTLGGFKKYEG